MKLARRHAGAWSEPARLCIAAWIVLLTLVCYYQVLYLYTTDWSKLPGVSRSTSPTCTSAARSPP